MRPLAALLLLIGCGCAQATQQHLFSGRGVTHVAVPGGMSDAEQGTEEVSVQGWVIEDISGKSLSLTFSNQTSATIPMSALVDEYTAKTVDGRIIALKDSDFLAYPDKMAPGEERTVTLRLPNDLSARDIAQIIAKLNQGKAVLLLQSIGPKEPPAWRVGRSAGVRVNEQTSLMRMQPPEIVKPLPPLALRPSLPQQPVLSLQPAAPPTIVPPVAPRSAAPPGTVAVNVSFRQALGSTLRAEIFWNDQGKHMTLATGDEQLFYLVPGQHEFHAVCRLPFMFETHARMPVIVNATEPIKIEMDAEAKLSGAEVRVRLYHGEKMTLDQRFSPLSSRHAQASLRGSIDG